jgi:hypothetical protein
MEKKFIGGILGIMFITLALCGCQGSKVEKNYGDIFQSSVVKLVNYSLDFERNQTGVITKATANGRISNLLDRILIVIINASFYDKNDNLLGQRTFTIYGLRQKGAPGYSTTFGIGYDDTATVALVDHIKMRAIEGS